MQKTIWVLLGFVLVSLCFSACDNELNVAAKWKEIAIIYGALNPTDTEQYIRIQRAYLDEDKGALTFSQEPDSLYFDTLTVTLDEFENGTYKKSYTLNRVNGNTIGLPKDSGIFSSGVNYLYQLKEPIRASSYFTSMSYVLTVKNPYTGYTSSSSTLIAGQAELSSPINDFIDQLFISAQDKHSIVAKYKEGVNVRSYDMIMEAHIEEIDKADTSKRTFKTLQWKMFSNKESRSLSGFNDVTSLVLSANFFSMLDANLKPNDNIYRRLVDYDLFLYGIGDDFYTYINVNRPSLGIVQKKPEYTNITNGYGLFSTRYINKYIGRNFHPNTRVQLNLSEDTKDLGFVLY
jgi:hypothetical protein